MGWTFFIFAIVAFVILGFLLFLILFEPGLPYKVCPRPIPIRSRGKPWPSTSMSDLSPL